MCLGDVKSSKYAPNRARVKKLGSLHPWLSLALLPHVGGLGLNFPTDNEIGAEVPQSKHI